ncbi:MAG: hypothetical protein GY844_36205 [Bradyrhizobium sp.]|nr:hypothetical protein [Bradyrhizobium sp.]
MADNSRPVRTSDPFDRFDEAINDPGLYPAYQYERPESRQLQPVPQDRVPLFLSDYDQQYGQERFEDEAPEYTFGSRREKPRTSRIIATGVVVATVVAATVGFFAMDATRSVFVNAKASLASVAPSFGGSAPPDAAPPPRVAIETAAPQPRIAAPEAQAVYRGKPAEAAVAPTAAAAAVAGKPAEMANAALPSREEISAAYQSAVKGGQVAAVAPAAPAPPPAAPAVRRMDPDEVAGLLKRAKGLLAIGDFVSARLLLERAADAQEAEAAFMLGNTYDPLVIGNQDMRSITPDPAVARQWYQKAATLGSADAKRRLSQLQN